MNGKALFYFVRHGQSEGNKSKILSGQIDHALTEQGLEEARETAKVIPADYDAVYSSDLIRCRQTADIVNTKHLPVTYDRRLRERNFGSLQGKNLDEVRSFFLPQGQYDYRPYGGESFDDVKARVLSFLEDTKRTGAKHVLVVTSEGVIRLLHFVFNEKLEMKVSNASVHEFEL